MRKLKRNFSCNSWQNAIEYRRECSVLFPKEKNNVKKRDFTRRHAKKQEEFHG